MKAQNIILVLVVVFMLVSLGGTYMLFIKQGTVSVQKIDALKGDIDDLGVSLKKVDSQFKDLEAQSKGYTDSIKSLEDKVNAGDSERKDIAAKVTDLMKAVDEIKSVAKSTVEAKQAVVPAEPSVVVEPAAEVTTPEAAPETVSVTQPESVDLGQIPVQKENE
ncbi:MAG: hypothetical protein HZB36_08640 [Candidatus Omnitrophica bacterium]|nr:hypothetical protein [Candidatus Omnitrophota bacterium]